MRKSILFLSLQAICIYSIAQAPWQQTGPNGGGQVEVLATSGSNLFAGTATGGVFLSNNSGTSWIPVNNGLSTLDVRVLGINGTNIFAGTNGGGVFLSSNNGTSWTAMNTGLTNLSVHGTFAFSGNNLFAGTDGGGVFLSTNNGTSWTAVNSGLTNLRVYSLVISGTNLLAGTWGGGIFLSTNNGTSWTAVNSGLTNLSVNSMVLSGTNIFAGTLGGGTFLSTNNGTNWTAVNVGLTNLTVNAFAVSGSNLFSGTNGGVFLSTNNGKNWIALNNGLTQLTVWALAINGTDLFAGCNASAWKNSLFNSISGTITYSGGPAINGYAKLYHLAKNSRMIKADSVRVSSGNYAFSNVITGDYILYSNAKSTLPNTIGTFADSTYTWDTASVITATLGASLTKNIKLIELPTVTGTASISGTIKQGHGFHSMYNLNDPVGGIDVGLKKRPSGIAVLFGQTDGSGQYTFANVPADNYTIYVSIPGLKQVSTYNLTIPVGSTNINRDFIADSAKIYIDSVASSGIQEMYLNNDDLIVWPVPAKDFIQMAIEDGSPASGAFQATIASICDVSGRQVKYKKFDALDAQSTLVIDISDIPDGLYLLKVQVGNRNYFKKVIKLK
jgi:hypothetical protein